jgi:hypothetical protein
MHRIGQCVLLLGTALLTVMSIGDVVFAQGKTVISPGPAPLIGIGLPVAGLALAAVLLIRRYRKD